MRKLEKQIKCVICENVSPSVYMYHKHNIRQHSLVQLSRAILKLQKLQLPLTDPMSDDEDEDDEEERKRLELDMAEVLDIPIKCEMIDEEVIELGPTENADNLQVQSRLFKNPKKHSRQIIEVLEDKQPSSFVEDPDAIIVKFNRELVMALDTAQPTVRTPYQDKKKSPNRNMRAIWKNTIEIPDASAYAKDFKQCGSNSNDKYVMGNVALMDREPKRRRGRPRKIKPPPFVDFEDFDGDPDYEGVERSTDPLTSDNKDEEYRATVPNMTRSRSGRIIKAPQKNNATYKYYDVPSKDLSEKDTSGSKGQKVEPDNHTVMGNFKRKRNSSEELKSIACSKVDSSQTLEILSSDKLMGSVNGDRAEHIEVEVSSTELGLSMPLITHHLENPSDLQFKKTSEGEGVYECLLCCRHFNDKEDWEKHMQDHIMSDIPKPNDILNSSTDNLSDRILSDSEILKAIIKDDTSRKNEDADFQTPVCVPDESSDVSSTLTCTTCNGKFHSEKEFKSHSHDNLHECHICFKRYQGKINLQAHIKRYHQDTDWMKYKCSTCGKSFGFLLAFERHMKEHNPGQKFCCDHCGKVFKTLVNLKNHIPLHTKEEVFECPYCPKQYYIKYSYEKHIKTHEATPKHHCKICDRKFIEKKQFDIHMERHESRGSHGRSKDFKCNHCGDMKTQDDLYLIGLTDVGHHKTCIVCSKGFYKKYIFVVDNQGASEALVSQTKEEKPREQCKCCGKFVLDLPRHLRTTHFKNEYVACNICGMVVTKTSLPSHKNRKHGAVRVTCDHCGQNFKNIMSLREHMAKVRKKDDPSKNVCKFCKEIVSAENWKEHMTKHKSKCSDCGADNFASHEEFLAHLDLCRRCSNCNLSTFASKEDFLSHIEICSSGIDVITNNLDSTTEQEVVTSIFAIVDGNSCGLCGAMFTDQESLSQHIATLHPETIPSEDIFSDSMMSEAILYVCPKDACGAILTSKDLFKSHLISVHNENDQGMLIDTQGMDLGQKYLYSSEGFKSLL